jgi:hypothetical protein
VDGAVSSRGGGGGGGGGGGNSRQVGMEERNAGKQARRQQANKQASERGSKRWRKLTTDIVSCLGQTPIIKCQNEGVSRRAPNTV